MYGNLSLWGSNPRVYVSAQMAVCTSVKTSKFVGVIAVGNELRPEF